MLIAQITDLHVTMPDGDCDRAYATADHLCRTVAHLNDLSPQPDIVLATGDLVDGGSAEEYARLAGILGRLDVQLYLIPGNHDDRAQMAAAFPTHDYLPQGGDFIHYVIDGWPVRLIGLDTLIPGEIGGRLCNDRLAWLDERLGEDQDTPTLLFMHHPPFQTGNSRMDKWGLEGASDFAALLNRYDHVERIICGHVHRLIMQRFANTVAVSSPATAHQFALELGQADRIVPVMEPPAAMLHYWMEDGGGLVSHVSYTTPGTAPEH